MKMKVSELLTDESKWCKRTMAKDISGYGVPFDSAYAVCWCLLGAAAACGYTSAEMAAFEKAICAVAPMSAVDTTNVAIALWQDAAERTFDQVYELLLSIGH